MSNLLITIEEVRNIGQLSIHCDKSKIILGITQAQNHDMKKLLQDFWYIVLENKDNEIFHTLLFGGKYEVQSGGYKYHEGLKNVLAHYAYARYIMLNEYNDTPVGNMDFQSSFYSSKSSSSIKMQYDYYRNLAHALFKDVDTYLCFSKSIFPEYNSSECGPCLNNTEKNSSSVTPYGIKSSVITKKITPLW
ncbi:hypothetical protein ETU09_08170 [Apibacter muscae]|uniref:Uncharacterized protein n=1 Tax=Apibacter muscae TaxID=2509004 RepID=A0A563DA45_9FLAO|nr:hypothetical protein [Apibacter muscae]TWP27086.1 hypothetical protein ETU09_08170 [Apibacter muscae]